VTSDYDLAMGQDQDCKYLGTHKTDRKGVKRARQLIEDGYVAEWIVDNLPGATSFVTVDKTHKYYAAGFKIGYKDFSPVTGKPRYFLNNHHTFVIRWRKAPGRAGERGEKVMVGFEVYPKSIEAGHRNSEGCPQDVHGDMDGLEIYIAANSTMLAGKYPHSSYLPEEDDIDDGSMLTIPYSYSVYWREEERVEWSKRWEMYFNNQEEGTSIHWLAIANSLIICGLLSAVVVMIVHRTIFVDGKGHLKEEEGKVRLKKKKSRAAMKSPKSMEKGSLLEQTGDAEDLDISSDEESIEDVTGWKLLHGDVFRPPPYAGFLAPLIGSGMQLVFMSTALLLLSCVGILNPSFRGGFVSVGMGLFIFAGVFSGYFSARVYKTFGGVNWRRNTMMVSHLYNPLKPHTDESTDRSPLPRPPLHHHLHPQSLRLGPSIQYRPSLQHPPRPPLPLALHSAPARLHRELVRLSQQPRLRTSNQNQQPRPPDPRASLVYQKHLQRAPRGPRPLCRHLHRAPLRLPQLMAGQEWVLLRLWLPHRRQPRQHNYGD